MMPGTAIVRVIFPEAVPREEALACLTPEEKSHAGRFRFQNDAEQWIACRASLRKILGETIAIPPLEVPLIVGEFGKPGLAPPHDSLYFNLSHCAGLALVALSTEGPVGVDIEPENRAESLLECERSFCHPQEIRHLPLEATERASTLLRIWTHKEAVLKAMGTGLSHPPEKVRILFAESNTIAISDEPLAGIENQRLHPLGDPLLSPYQAVISSPQTVSTIKFIQPILAGSK
jgi:4'-phosphopantetheinyl transferase